MLVFQVTLSDESMHMVYGALAVEGANWESADNIPLMIANTVYIHFVALSFLIILTFSLAHWPMGSIAEHWNIRSITSWTADRR